MMAAVCRAPGDPEWRLIGKYATRERALAVLALLIALAKDLTDGFRQLYFVEHILLRFGRNPEGTGDDNFPYSFTITAVVSDAPHRSDRRGYRDGVAEVIRRNAPAHVAVAFCFLRPRRMIEFEALYYTWRRALRHGDPGQIAAASRRLRLFLEWAAAISAQEQS